MKIGKKSVNVFKMENRRGYAALCGKCLTEGSSKTIAFDRMIKAIARIERKKKKKN